MTVRPFGSFDLILQLRWTDGALEVSRKNRRNQGKRGRDRGSKGPRNPEKTGTWRHPLDYGTRVRSLRLAVHSREAEVRLRI